MTSMSQHHFCHVLEPDNPNFSKEEELTQDLRGNQPENTGHNVVLNILSICKRSFWTWVAFLPAWQSFKSKQNWTKLLRPGIIITPLKRSPTRQETSETGFKQISSWAKLSWKKKRKQKIKVTNCPLSITLWPSCAWSPARIGKKNQPITIVWCTFYQFYFHRSSLSNLDKQPDWTGVLMSRVPKFTMTHTGPWNRCT